MPIYEYLCDSCHHRFDIKQKFSDDALTTCPNCGQRIHRVMQPAKVVFKGSGFYITDHKSGGSAVLDGGKSEAKTDAKSASGADATTAGEKGEKAAKTESTTTSSSDSSSSPTSSTPAPAAASSSTSSSATS